MMSTSLSRLALLAALLGILPGCVSQPARITASSPPLAALDGPRLADLAFRALGLVGTPYRSAGSDPQIGFDCSGFVVYLYQDVFGLRLPRSTQGQYELASRGVPRKALQTGDLVFFDTSGRGVSHVGIYVGESRFVHAPNHGGRVRLDHLDDRYWQGRYRGAKRVIS